MARQAPPRDGNSPPRDRESYQGSSGGFVAAPAMAPSSMPSLAAKFGVVPEVWVTLKTSVFPGAADDSIVAAVAYCQARQLDVLKKPCHIVPMKVKDATTGAEAWRDIIMPGIYELRATAMRTQEYVGQPDPEYGPVVEVPVYADNPEGETLSVPEWCRIVVRRYNRLMGAPVEFSHIEYFRECVVRTGGGAINRMWRQRSIGQLTKCAEAGALRKAFPEELGGMQTGEEMEGREIARDADLGGEPSPGAAPTGAALTTSIRAIARAMPVKPGTDVMTPRGEAPAARNPDAAHLIALATDAPDADTLDFVRSKRAEIVGQLTADEAAAIDAAVAAAVERLQA